MSAAIQRPQALLILCRIERFRLDIRFLVACRADRINGKGDVKSSGVSVGKPRLCNVRSLGHVQQHTTQDGDAAVHL